MGEAMDWGERERVGGGVPILSEQGGGGEWQYTPKEPGKVVAGKIKRSQLSEIAEAKMKDLNANDIDAATKIIEGSARAMGLEVVEG